MGTRALWRFDETKTAIRSSDAIGNVADMGPITIPLPWSVDATSNKGAPANATEWLAAYAATAGIGVAIPQHLYLLQEAAGNAADSIGAALLVPSGPPGYQQAIAGWSRKCITFTDGTTIYFNNGGGVGVNMATTSALSFTYGMRTGTPAATRILCGMGGALYANILSAHLDTSNHLGIGVNAAVTNSGTVDYGSGVIFPMVVQHDRTNGVQRILTDKEVITKAYGALSNENGQYFLGTLGGVFAAPFGYAYNALITGAGAELTSAQIKSLLTTLGWSGIPWS